MLAGRAEDAAWLRHAVAAPRGALVVVSGEAGAGKSRLLDATLRGTAAAWVAFPRARHAAPGHGLRAVLAALGAPADDGGGTDVAAAAARRSRMFGAVAAALAASPGAVVVLDDAQWADELTIAWLAQAVAELSTTAARLVLGVRTAGPVPDALAPAVAAARRARLLHERTLAPLTPDGVRAVAAEHGVTLDDAAVARIHAATDGLALAVDEVLRTRATPTSPGSVVADLVRDLTGELSQGAAALVAAAAAAPQPVSEPLLRAVAAVPAYDAALAEVEETGLLARAAPALLAFRHELFRESVYAAIPLAERRRLHRRAADLLAATPDAPARVIAAQLLGAGDVVDALPHLDRAADAALVANDIGNAVAHLRTAVEVCPPELAERRVELAERAAVLAIAGDDPPAALAVVDPLLGGDLDPVLRGRVLLTRARVVTFAGDFAARIADLGAARAAFERAGDDTGTALSLAETALPVADVLPLAEHVRLGRLAVAIAERGSDRRALSLACGNLAAAELMTGNAAAFDLWERAAEVAPSGTEADAELTFRVRQNWVQALLVYGRYDEADAALREWTGERALRAASNQREAVLRWRRGEWDAAVAAAERGEVDRASARATATAVAAMVSFERDRRPDVTPLAEAAAFLVADWDELWAPLAVACLAEVRAIRREPRPERGVAELLRRIRSSGAVVGWEDLLTVPALLTGPLGARLAALIEDVRPVGPRGDAAVPFALGVRASAAGDDGAADLLVASAEAFLALGEPYPAARAYVAAASARRARGRRAGDLRIRAATLFRDIGADRSLAALLRTSSGSRALEGFRVPAGQRHAATAGLTERERDVADLARWGLTAREIADRLGIADSTVRTHLERVKAKLGTRRARDLVRLLGDAP